MRIYLNCREAIADIGRELRKCASEVHTQTYQNKEIANDPNFNTKELEFYNLCIINTEDKDLMPGVTLNWAKEEFKERVDLEPINPGSAYLLRQDVWEQFINEEGFFDYTYNERIRLQLRGIIEELGKHPETRQAIIEIHNNDDDLACIGERRVPCSLNYHFLKRNGKLDIIYTMRSSDFSTHFQNDIWLADELRRYVANRLGIEPGLFFMSVHSLHIYKKDWEELTKY